jgi:hypothetical protein
LSSAERAIRKDFGTIQSLELIAARAILVDEDIVAIGGTGRGADTAIRIKPAHATKFFDLRIEEVIAKPSNF